MRKPLFWPIVLLLLILGFSYIVIPANLLITTVEFVHAPASVVSRHTLNDRKWSKWWLFSDSLKDEKFAIDNQKLSYGSTFYHCRQQEGNVNEIMIKDGSKECRSLMSILSISMDSSVIHWTCSQKTSLNPFYRIKAYIHSITMENNMKHVLERFSGFMAKPENPYGMLVQRTSTTDTLLLVAKHLTRNKPTTLDVDSFLRPLKVYIYRQGALATGAPMLHVERLPDSAGFQTMVAIPVNKTLKPEKVFSFIRLVPGYFLTAEVKGGMYTIENQMQELRNFLQDHQQTNMAISFEIMETDRISEPDTSRWQTRLFMPVMQ